MVKNKKSTFANKQKVAPKEKPSFVSAKPKTEKTKESSPFSKIEQIVTTVIILVAFVALAAYELIVNNSDTLFMAQGRSMFTYGCEFFDQFAKAPGALGAWLGCYFTQFFYHPEVGASILIGFWCILFFLIKKAFRISNFYSFIAIIPVVFLLISIIFNGYWLYYVKQPGYWFRETIGFMYAMGTVLAVSRLNKYVIPQTILSVLLIMFGYFYFGYYGLLAGLCIIINEWCNIKNQSVKGTSIVTALTAIAAIVFPYVCYNSFFTEIRREDVFTACFPFFLQDSFEDYQHSYPFYAIIAILFILPFLRFLPKNPKLSGLGKMGYRLAVIALLYGIATFVDSKDFKDYNFHAEMRMYDAADNGRWDDVIEESADYTQYSFQQRSEGNANAHPTRQMVILTHLALLNKGTMGSQMYKFNNFGASPFVPDTTFVPKTQIGSNGHELVYDEQGKEVIDTLCLKVHMVQTAGPLIYYLHAKTNFASRWCIENSVEFGYTFNETKLLVRCALVNGEWDVAKKYLDVLEKSIYYKEWAQKYRPILADHKLMKNYHEFDNVLELYNHMGTVLDGDQGLCEMYLLGYFSNTMNKDSKLLQELTLNYAMINKDIQLFWPRFFLYAQLNKDKPMPVHYQEAAFLYGNLERNVDISHMPFDEAVKKNYADFQRISHELLSRYTAEAMRAKKSNQLTPEEEINIQKRVRDFMEPTFGHTFYWFYFFCRDVRSY